MHYLQMIVIDNTPNSCYQREKFLGAGRIPRKLLKEEVFGCRKGTTHVVPAQNPKISPSEGLGPPRLQHKPWFHLFEIAQIDRSL